MYNIILRYFLGNHTHLFLSIMMAGPWMLWSQERFSHRYTLVSR